MSVLLAIAAIQRQPRWRIMSFCVFGLAVVGVVDCLAVNELAVTLLYLLPLSIGAWFVSRPFGLVLAVAGAAVYCASEALEKPDRWSWLLLVNTAVEGAVFVGVALLFSSLRTYLEAKRHALSVAEEALAHVRQLSALLPMCSSCRKIRHEPDGSWQPFDVYLLNHSDTRVSHGMCPDCMARLYPEEFRRMQEKKM